MKIFRNLTISSAAAAFIMNIGSITAQVPIRDSFYVAEWNLENLYDTLKDPLKNDDEFLPGSIKRWNEAKLEQKIDHLTFVINSMNKGCGPDVIAVEEVENIGVVKRLLYMMRDRDYVVVHRDSPDEKGIDVALVYDRNRFDIDSVAALHVELPNHIPTRDILHTVLIDKKFGYKIHFYVNHWPSGKEGLGGSEANRFAAVDRLRLSLDTLERTEPESNTIILGDFNEGSDGKSVIKLTGLNNYDCESEEAANRKFINLAGNKNRNGEGTFFFKGKMEMVDQMIISGSMTGKGKINYECGSFEIIKPDFMVYKGEKAGRPIPTYIGNRYIGGYSDHFPIGARFNTGGSK
jgi:Endonuclease/Exonuclease/phosphatase family